MQGSKEKYVFGIAKLSEKGQIVIPKEAREVFGLKPGDQLLLMGDIKRGLALIKVDEIGLLEALAERDEPNGEGGDPS